MVLNRQQNGRKKYPMGRSLKGCTGSGGILFSCFGGHRWVYAGDGNGWNWAILEGKAGRKGAAEEGMAPQSVQKNAGLPFGLWGIKTMQNPHIICRKNQNMIQ